MQPSEIHLHKELKEFKETLKTAQTSEKQGIKNRIKEIENILGIKPSNEKATIATDEQPE